MSHDQLNSRTHERCSESGSVPALYELGINNGALAVGGQCQRVPTSGRLVSKANSADFPLSEAKEDPRMSQNKIKGKRLTPETKAIVQRLKEAPRQELTLEQRFENDVDWVHGNMPARFEMTREEVAKLLRRTGT